MIGKEAKKKKDDKQETQNRMMVEISPNRSEIT